MKKIIFVIGLLSQSTFAKDACRRMIKHDLIKFYPSSEISDIQGPCSSKSCKKIFTIEESLGKKAWFFVDYTEGDCRGSLAIQTKLSKDGKECQELVNQELSRECE